MVELTHNLQADVKNKLDEGRYLVALHQLRSVLEDAGVDVVAEVRVRQRVPRHSHRSHRLSLKGLI